MSDRWGCFIPAGKCLNNVVYQLIYCGCMSDQMQIFRGEVLRFPRLDTVLMIEKAILDAKGDFTVRKLWQKLPKQVMWQTFLAALDYLEYSGKILIDEEKHPIWIWAPRDVERLKKKGLVVK
ncbi:MAG: hypothetical protein J4215_04210 [Candidatus Diapherotrites archaeon]|uniref:Uncharacterized protein n=1 Tax=Candidatus Iainarchaeum sp. TaxID=3101447 RepID=A0A8T4L592_9ARCH|nr:hypothetical protein [Candidatus Diapherotrites archaeon]